MGQGGEPVPALEYEAAASRLERIRLPADCALVTAQPQICTQTLRKRPIYCVLYCKSGRLD